jgi:hypothetical protein
VSTETSQTTVQVCVICYDELHQDNAAGTWPCRHRQFCVECINRWCEERDTWTCPLCRSEIVAILSRDTGAVQISFKSTRASLVAIMSFAPEILEFADSVMDGLQQRCDLETPRDHEQGLGADEQVEGDSVQALDDDTEGVEKDE